MREEAALYHELDGATPIRINRTIQPKQQYILQLVSAKDGFRSKPFVISPVEIATGDHFTSLLEDDDPPYVLVVCGLDDESRICDSLSGWPLMRLTSFVDLFKSLKDAPYVFESKDAPQFDPADYELVNDQEVDDE